MNIDPLQVCLDLPGDNCQPLIWDHSANNYAESLVVMF